MPFNYEPLKTMAELVADPQKLLTDIKAYFEYCDSTKEELTLKNGDKRIRCKTPSVLGLTQWLHTHRNTLYRLIDQSIEDSLKDANLKGVSEDAQIMAGDILTYAKQEMILRLAERSLDGDANDKVSQAMLARYGEIGEDKTNISLQITVAGADSNDVDSWSK